MMLRCTGQGLPTGKCLELECNNPIIPIPVCSYFGGSCGSEFGCVGVGGTSCRQVDEGDVRCNCFMEPHAVDTLNKRHLSVRTLVPRPVLKKTRGVSVQRSHWRIHVDSSPCTLTFTMSVFATGVHI